MRSVGEGVGILVARDVEAGEIAAGVAAIDSAIGEHRRGPAFGAGHLSAGNLLELTGIGLRHDEFALVADNEQFFGDSYSEVDIASVITYTRQAWSNGENGDGVIVTPKDIVEYKKRINL